MNEKEQTKKNNSFIEIEDFLKDCIENEKENYIEINGAKYKPKFTPDWDALVSDLYYMKGRNRSMRQFAKACGLSPATMTKLVNKEYKNRLSLKMLKKFLRGSEENTNNGLKNLMVSLLRDNGYILESELNENPNYGDDTQVLSNELKYGIHPKNLHQILSNALFERGLSYTVINDPNVFRLKIRREEGEDKRSDIPESKLGMIAYDGRYGVVTYHIQGYEPMYLKYLSLANEIKIVSKETLWNCLDTCMVSMLFLRDAWDPEATRNFSYTIVFRMESVFNIFVEIMKDIRVNNYISAILVDMESKTIIDEFAIPRVEGESFKIFTK